MPAQWIKLTGKDAAAVFVNMASVSMMRPHKRLTRLWFTGEREDYVDVAEPPEVIITRLDEQLVAEREAAAPAPPPPMLEPPYPAATSAPVRRVVESAPAEPEPAMAPAAPAPRPAPRDMSAPQAKIASISAMNGAGPKTPARDAGKAASKGGMSAVAAKLARSSAAKISSLPLVAREETQISKTVAEQREQRAQRRVSAILDERRQQLARKLEAMTREKSAE